MNERAWLAEFATAPPDRLRTLLRDISPEIEVALSSYLGAPRYQRLRTAAERPSVTATRAVPRRNVVVIPGMMGSELSVTLRQRERRVWLNYFRLATGWLPTLRLTPAGESPDHDLSVRPTGVLNKYYGELILKLAGSCNVRTFAYDWRKNVEQLGAELLAFVNAQFPDQEVSLIAHSLGGLVARTMFSQASQQAGEGKPPARFQRLVLLGTPNFGSYEAPRILTGLQDAVAQLTTLVSGAGLIMDHDQARHQVLETVASFPSVYQMLPWSDSPKRQKSLARLRDPASYQAGPNAAALPLVAAQFEASASLQRQLAGGSSAKLLGGDRITYVAGVNRATPVWNEAGSPGDPAAYELTIKGDGRVPLELGLLPGAARTFYLEEDHGELPENGAILAGLEALLNGDEQVAGLLTSWVPPAGARGAPATVTTPTEFAEVARRLDSFAVRLGAVPFRRTPVVSKPTDACLESLDIQPTTEPDQISPDENLAESMLLGGFLGGARWAGSESAARLLGSPAPQLVPVETPPTKPASALTKLVVLHGSIDQSLDVDAIAVGYYPGFRPQDAFAALDAAVTSALRGTPSAGDTKRRTTTAPAKSQDSLFDSYVERGLLRAPLGQHFFFPDPRDQSAQDPRIIALCSLGTPGRFGQPESVVLVRELAWSLNALGRKRLASVLIGAGQNNLSVFEAASGWLRGLARAADVGTEDGGPLLESLTFVERDFQRARELYEALASVVRSMEQQKTQPRLFELGPVPEENVKLVRQLAATDAAGPRTSDRERDIATRLYVERRGKTWSLSAMTDKAAVPERYVTVDPLLIEQASRSLAGKIDTDDQQLYGMTLEMLVIPKDLREHLYGGTPLVLSLDSTTARVPWEMLVTPTDRVDPNALRPAGPAFLGLTRGLTRQLRTQFAHPPEPPTVSGRELRVLIVADPSAKHPLPNAQREGREVFELFDAFQQLQPQEATRQVVVRHMVGPLRATRLKVLAEITARNYDVLHFCGHCTYDEANPEASGWIFEDGVLSAQELTRLDRVPRFVFSNACQSGVTPERAELASSALAPSFAEAFFRQGVANFICTGWPVDDSAARMFALTLYANLLGLAVEALPVVANADVPKEAIDIGTYRVWRSPQSQGCCLHEALRNARETLYLSPVGRGSWGAYQHYGSPFFRLT